MPNIRLTIEYDGSLYHGWQHQKKAQTLQGILEDALFQITKEKIKTNGAGRTDAGVHAYGQVANFSTRTRLDSRAWLMALNFHLPEQIVVKEVKTVSHQFHARYDASSKTYRYQILNRSHRSAVGGQYQWVVFPKLKLDRMKRAARFLVGRKDFSAFRSGGAKNKPRSSICNITRLTLSKKGDEISIVIEADHFLQQMVRTIVGTLVAVGRGRLRPSQIKEILLSLNRAQAAQTAPPQGLFLVSVKY